MKKNTLYGIFVIIGMVILSILFWLLSNPFSDVGDFVYCSRGEVMGHTYVMTGEIIYSKKGVYIISGYYETEDISEDGNRMVVVGSGFDNNNLFREKDCMSKTPPKMYKDKIDRFIELGGYYFE